MKKFFLATIVLFSLACTEEKNPVEELALQNSQYPEYSVILTDMRESPEKSHKYKIVVGKPENPKDMKDLTFTEKTTGWIQVPDRIYDKYLADLGMVILAKRDGKVSGLPRPPGYDKVGNSEYGQWKEDENGNSFWAFYGQYMLFSHLMGMGHSNVHVYRSDYDTYQHRKKRGKPYYGKTSNGKTRFGTNGTVARKSNTTFSKRWNAKNSKARSKFAQRVKAKRNSKRNFSTRVKAKANSQRGRSSMSGVRSRSGRAGK